MKKYKHKKRDNITAIKSDLGYDIFKGDTRTGYINFEISDMIMSDRQEIKEDDVWTKIWKYCYDGSHATIEELKDYIQNNLGITEEEIDKIGGQDITRKRFKELIKSKGLLITK